MYVKDQMGVISSTMKLNNSRVFSNNFNPNESSKNDARIPGIIQIVDNFYRYLITIKANFVH